MTMSSTVGKDYRVWAEIDLRQIKANFRTLLAANQGRALMAVVKADAYGHGAVPVARACLEAGAVWLGVAVPEEGVQLREAGIEAPVLVLGASVPGDESVAAAYSLTLTVATHESVEALCRASAGSRPLRVHMKIDTGMGRLGFLPSDAVSASLRLQENGIFVDGIFTHLATADEIDTAYALSQLQRFAEVRAALSEAGLRPRWYHVGNTAGIKQSFPDECNMARSGIGIYGYSPSPALAENAPVVPAMSWRAHVVSVRRLPAGSFISYGATYATPRETTIVALPVGYAHGFTRRLSHRAHVLLGGRRFPVVGVICMDQCLVDVGDYPAYVGEEAVLMGRQGGEQITADDLAIASGTISDEIICEVSRRVPRVYSDE